MNKHLMSITKLSKELGWSYDRLKRLIELNKATFNNAIHYEQCKTVSSFKTLIDKYCFLEIMENIKKRENNILDRSFEKMVNSSIVNDRLSQPKPRMKARFITDVRNGYSKRDNILKHNSVYFGSYGLCNPVKFKNFNYKGQDICTQRA